ncbi:uncharacterized protein LOC121248345 [Juglans microcarpa x Juglans regia]|uniref:uncharacterized protein LOC121248345 n=1 Tax=Juglans microcarpa x Juglans regia TaxID=2249226 RepID=UPI001B7E28A9|nr:uncharacterized protein LOC121248345 [Juglans microcarpa x Juglans regia]
MDVMDHEQKRGESTSKNLRVHFDVPPTIDPSIHHQRSGSTPSSGSSLDLDAIENVLDNLSSQESKKSTLEMQEATSSADHSSSPPPVGSNQSGYSPQSAPIQVMPGRATGYDPNRIPSSIFSTPKPTTAMDWSTASNESLFSIHIGNSSFSREHFIMLNRSGELPRTDELTGLPTTLPSVSETGEDHKSETANAEKDAEVIEGSGQSGNGAWWGSSPNNNKEKTSPKDVGARNYNTTSYRSDESNHSAHSFNFPLLAGDHSGLSSPATLDMEKQHLQQQLPPQNPQIMTSKRGWNNMFCCFSFRSRYWAC